MGCRIYCFFFFFKFPFYIYFREVFVKNFIEKLSFLYKNVQNSFQHVVYSEVYIWGGEWGNSPEPLASFVDTPQSSSKGHTNAYVPNAYNVVTIFSYDHI